AGWRSGPAAGAEPAQPAQPPVAKEEAKPKAPAAAEKSDTPAKPVITIRVLDPDGKSLAGARILTVQSPPWNVLGGTREVGKTDAEGRFGIDEASFGGGPSKPLVAVAEGLAADWIDLGRHPPAGDVTLRLTKPETVRGPG